MTDTTEQKALALVNEVRAERRLTLYEAPNTRHTSFFKALCRAIEQHEAFRQQVSDAGENILTAFAEGTDWTPEKRAAYEALAALIVAKPKHTDTSRSGDLVKMLRAGDLCGLTLAADRIEALEAENERLREALGLADAALRGANMNMNVVERKLRAALEARHD